ncbi:HIT zinc finger containing protein [Leishmania donovani]|uniref:HIT_zinc_finger_containing_protein_putative/Pfam: PF04438 n=1 Tax=Leishmania donovani TaxID=5661 RepID=A0A6J8F9N8_LEIDO|nr:HIT zinc finger containing protein [Leishmania donovani]VDZ42816.1 HIT_zinc_finger_containing_protein_putative/Pfam:PF04438 [Leishmania donovani]
MSRACSGGRSAEQLERLARLSEDNAFVDVGATLKRIGGEDAWESTVGGDGTFDGPASSIIGLLSSSGGASTASGATAAAAGGKRGQARKGTRASEDALLNGSRIPLTASLQDQHKAYLESVRAAAKEWEEVICSSSGDDGSAADSADGDDKGVNRIGGVQTAERRGVGPKARRGGPKAKAFSAETLPPASLSSWGHPSEMVTVTSVRRSPADGAAVARKRPRGAQRACRDTADAEAERKVNSAAQSARPDPCSSLVAKLKAELRLVRQWERTMLEFPPQIVNGVLSPESRAPWAQASSTSRKTDAATVSSEAKYVDSDDDTEVLPHPLLQVYSLCPSYEALTAGPVHRRDVVRCATTEEGWGHKEKPRRSLLAPSPTPTEAATRTVHVAGFTFAVPEQVFGSRKRRSRRKENDSGHATGLANGGQVDFIDPGSEDAVQGEREHHLCSVCMLPASYRCLRCRTALFCSIDCHVLHDATRCLKFTV